MSQPNPQQKHSDTSGDANPSNTSNAPMDNPVNSTPQTTPTVNPSQAVGQQPARDTSTKNNDNANDARDTSDNTPRVDDPLDTTTGNI